MQNNNMINLASKDFRDLLSNKCIIITIALYLLMILFFNFLLNDQVLHGVFTNDQLFSMSLGWCGIIMSYGSIIGVMIGFSLIASEKFGNALNTLITKPLYRDTIINGKLLACMLFLLVVFGLTISLYFSMLLILFKASIGYVLVAAFSRIVLAFYVAMLYVLIFTLISMLIPIIIKRQSIALLLVILILILLRSVIPTVSFAGNIYHLLGGQAYNLVVTLCPDWAYSTIVTYGLYDPSVSTLSLLNNCWSEIVNLFLYAVVLLVICYISFIRRDIA
jgi:ABC-2 type transport system permease protein